MSSLPLLEFVLAKIKVQRILKTPFGLRGDNIADLIKRGALPLELKSDNLRQTGL